MPFSPPPPLTFSLCEFSLVIRVEHARYYCGFYCHAKVGAYARCRAIQQSVGHNRPDSRSDTKYANSADVGAGLTKTINANDCMCSYIDGFIKISIRTRARIERDGNGGRDGPKRKEKIAARCESGSTILFSHSVKPSARYTLCGLTTSEFAKENETFSYYVANKNNDEGRERERNGKKYVFTYVTHMLYVPISKIVILSV